MKNILPVSMLFLMLLLRATVFSQSINVFSPYGQADQWKSSGNLEAYFKSLPKGGQPIEYDPNQFVNQQTPAHRSASTSCNCWLTRDATWQLAPFAGYQASNEYRNDDGSTPVINLPFNFCFYGSPINRVYINTNGNVSIGSAYSTFSANGFPDPTYSMIAPFWADVDIRGTGSGLVYYQLTATHLIVQWDQVGYYPSRFDKLNTFQLIMTDGNDPLLPTGTNVQFCYRDMQWTTGGASQGVNGFGGIPANVGVNRGGASGDYIQIGRYNSAGTFYDGPYNDTDGVDMLDNKTFIFNVCVSSHNTPPIIQSDQICDTLTVCENDTLLIDATFLSPDSGQLTTPSVNANGLPGVSVVSSTVANVAAEQIQIIGQSSNLGFHTIYLVGTDNGSPPQSSSAPIVITVQPAPHNVSFSFAPSGPQPVGTPLTFTPVSTGGFFYAWNWGDGTPVSSLRNPVHTYQSGGTFTVTLTITGINGCSTTVTQQVVVTQCAVASFTTNDVCAGSVFTLNFTGTAVPGANFTWDFGGGNVISGNGSGPYEIIWDTAGIHTILLTIDVPNCTTVTANNTVNIFAIPLASIAAPDSLCENQTGSLSFSGTAGNTANYSWTFGSGTVLNGTGAGPYDAVWNSSGLEQVSLIVTENGCADTVSRTVLINPTPTATFVIDTAVCSGADALLQFTGTASASAQYNWNYSGGTVTGGNGAGPFNIHWDSAATYQLGLNVMDRGCPSANEFASIHVVANPQANAGLDVSGCSGQVVNVGDASAFGNNYSWTPSGVLSDPLAAYTSITLNNADTVNHTDVIRLIVTNSLGCSDTDEVAVTTYMKAPAAFIPPNGQCIDGNSFTFISSNSFGPDYVYAWDFSNAANPAIAVGNIISGVNFTSLGYHTVTMQAAYKGCPGFGFTDSIEIYEMPVASFLFGPLEGCAPLTASFQNQSSSTAGTYAWSFEDGQNDTASNPTHTFMQDGHYDVALHVVSGNGCPDDTLIPDAITVYANPVAGFTPSSTHVEIYQPTFSFNNTSQLANQYVWDFGDNNGTSDFEPMHTYLDTGSYLVTLSVVGDHQCVDTTRLMLRVDPGYTFYIPGSFTPNGDGKNETFGGYGTWIYGYEMSIFDRWGTIIFHSDNINDRWDGKVNGAVQAEVYTYRIVVTDYANRPKVYVGRVTVLR